MRSSFPLRKTHNRRSALSSENRFRAVVSFHTLAILLGLANPVALTAGDQSPELFDEYEPGQSAVFGSVNPAAPAETEQFHFMVGEFECKDESRRADGSWISMRGRWRAGYIINGQAVIDQYWNERYAGMSVRHFDAAVGKWRVYFVGAPPTYEGQWLGNKEEETGNMVMLQERPRADGTVVYSRLTFSKISEEGFEWVGERVIGEEATPTWKISCRRD